MIDPIAWLVLRVVYAWMFLYPLKVLLKDWDGAVNLTSLVVPFATSFFTVLMFLTMLLGGISILLGFYGQLAGFALMVYCLLGAKVHYTLAKATQAINLPTSASQEEQDSLEKAIQLATVGHVTSAEKNFVLAAVGFFFMLMGTGPLSLT